MAAGNGSPDRLPAHRCRGVRRLGAVDVPAVFIAAAKPQGTALPDHPGQPGLVERPGGDHRDPRGRPAPAADRTGCRARAVVAGAAQATGAGAGGDRKSTRLNSSHVKISYAVFCLKKKKTT